AFYKFKLFFYRKQRQLQKKEPTIGSFLFFNYLIAFMISYFVMIWYLPFSKSTNTALLSFEISLETSSTFAFFDTTGYGLRITSLIGISAMFVLFKSACNKSASSSAPTNPEVSITGICEILN